MQGIEIWGTMEERIRGFWTSFGFRLLKYNVGVCKSRALHEIQQVMKLLFPCCAYFLHLLETLWAYMPRGSQRTHSTSLHSLFYLQYDTLYFTMMYITALQWCTLQLYNDVRYSGSYLINSHLLHWNKSMNEGAQRMKDYVCFVLCGILQHIAQWLTDSRGSIGNLPN